MSPLKIFMEPGAHYTKHLKPKTFVSFIQLELTKILGLTLLHSEWPKLYGVLAILSAIGLKYVVKWALAGKFEEHNF